MVFELCAIGHVHAAILNMPCAAAASRASTLPSRKLGDLPDEHRCVIKLFFILSRAYEICDCLIFIPFR